MKGTDLKIVPGWRYDTCRNVRENFQNVRHEVKNEETDCDGQHRRLPDDRLLKTQMLGMVEGEWQQGRPAWRWIDDILMWCDQDIKGAIQMTEDRVVWRKFVASRYGPTDLRT